MHCYTIELAFDHSLPGDQLEKVFDKVINRYGTELPKKPEYVLLSIGPFQRNYVFYLYVRTPKEIFQMHPEFVEAITKAWDEMRAKS